MAPVTHALEIALTYAGQVALVLGPAVVLAAVMQPVALRSERWTQELVGPRALWLAVGCLATALHEGAHAALALLFGHRVTRVTWTAKGDPDKLPSDVYDEFVLMAPTPDAAGTV